MSKMAESMRLADGCDFESLSPMAKKYVAQMQFMMQHGFADCEGALTWFHEGEHQQENGTLKSVPNSELWKEHGNPPAGLWVLHKDRQGYDFVATVTKKVGL